ncbi:MAG: FAD-binding oxidoreductase [Pyrinomonadaceae bacterium]|nr:FAD-binding oxidoreductase [Pyrinomonadaceae bacterium]
MQTKTEKDQFEDYLHDASNMHGGTAEQLFVPENEAEVSEVMGKAFDRSVAVTVSGARTGTVGGAVPFGGWILSLEKLTKLQIDVDSMTATVGAGVLLTDLQKEVDAKGLFYPPDPTEWSCQIGGNVATDASGARSFKYGSTRDYVKALKVVLADGDTVALRRGKAFASDGSLTLLTERGNKIHAKLPTYKPRNVRKDTSGFFVSESPDALDVFIGSEGLLGVITEIELSLLKKPEDQFSGIVFFDSEPDLLAFVNAARELSDTNRSGGSASGVIDASLIEYFDRNALDFIRGKFPETPEGKAGAIYFEQETSSENEDAVMEAWNALLEQHRSDMDGSWFAVSEADEKRMREFRHALPVAVNEKIVKFAQRKVGTDMAVPDEKFPSFLNFYNKILSESGLDHVIFGHIGDNHLHANIIPKNEEEAVAARHIYGRCVAQALMAGGTVSAEHGIGKLKSKYLYVMYGERFIHEMAELKKSFDVKNILNRGNMFDEKFLVV